MWNDTDTPLAYFISFRAYGTWLHGDGRGSIDRFNNRYRSPYMRPNENRRKYQQQRLRCQPLTLRSAHRKAVESAIRETCDHRKWFLQAVNVRTNHVHTVVSASHKKPEQVLGAFKANATRQLRQDGLWPHPFSPWAAKGSKRRLWNERSVARAIEYVMEGQGTTCQTLMIDSQRTSALPHRNVAVIEPELMTSIAPPATALCY